MDPVETTQSSVTDNPGIDPDLNGADDGGEDERESRAQRRIRELIDERKAAEERARRVEEAAAKERTEYLRLMETVAAKGRAADEEEDEDLDPAERRVRRLEAELAQFRQSQTQSAAQQRDQQVYRDIRVAVRDLGEWEDPEDVKERLAERYLASQRLGRYFDADAEAKALFDKERGRVSQREKARAKARAQEKKATEEATSSVVTATTSPPVVEPPTGAAPKWGTKERREWEQQMTAAILAKHRA